MAKNELYDWASKRSGWEQHALCILAESGSLAEDDLKVIVLNIEYQCGLSKEKPKLKELTKEHFNFQGTNEERTVLGALGPVENLDRLAENQRPIQFTKDGITIVYGANGSGKSGFCKIAKRLCRSLHSVSLRSNAYEPKAKTPKVKLLYQVGSSDAVPVDYSEGQVSPIELKRISVFDSANAGLYANSDRNIEFLPYELDLLKKLSDIYSKLSADFEQKRTQLLVDIKVALPTGYHANTATAQIVAKIKLETKFEDLPTEAELKKVGTWNDESQDRLDERASNLKSDPVKEVTIRERLRASLETVKGEIAAIEAVINKAGIADLKSKWIDATVKRDTASAAISDLFKNEPIPKLDSESWRQMLNYAREFASETFTEVEEPRLANGDKCVLCQQEVADDMVRQRLLAFDSYISDKANQDAVAAKEAYIVQEKLVKALEVIEKAKLSELVAGLKEHSDKGKEQVTAIETYMTQAKVVYTGVVKAITEKNYDTVELLELANIDVKEIDTLIETLKGEERYYKLLQNDKAKMEALTKELEELLDRKKLSSELATFVERLKKIREIHMLKKCIESCSTAAISRQVTKFRTEILTPSLTANLMDEIRELDLGYLPLKLKDKSDKGKNKIQVDLGSIQPIKYNSDILSEGEQRALALACFLAELKEAKSPHGIIIDDPVSSLDHMRMELVARRLIKEAQTGRQVIIFTHNLHFHFTLLNEADLAKVRLHTEWIGKDGDKRFGIVDDANAPWSIKRVNTRLDVIIKEMSAIKDTYNPDNEESRDKVRSIYTKLREASALKLSC